jgi:predicted PilT family ATPase
MENQQAQTHTHEAGDQQGRPHKHGDQQGRPHKHGDQHKYQNSARSRKDVSVKTIVPVHKDYVGAVIGKGGAMINQIKTDTETRISYMDQDLARGHQSPIFQITGSSNGVAKAERWVRRILQSTWQAEQGEGQEVVQESA